MLAALCYGLLLAAAVAFAFLWPEPAEREIKPADRAKVAAFIASRGGKSNA